MTRSEDEIKSLHLARLRQWMRTVEANNARIVELTQEIGRLREHTNYALLEAREERSLLIGMGVTPGEMSAVTSLPEMPREQAELLYHVTRMGNRVSAGVKSDDDPDLNQQHRGPGSDHGDG